MKGRIYLVSIRKHEAEELRKSGYGEFVKKNHSRYISYYLVEDKKVLKFLENFREFIKVK